MNKQDLLKEIWKECTLQEILDAGYETESLQAIDIIKEAEQIEKESFNVSLKVNFIDNLRELFDNTPSRELPYAREIMDEISAHYSDFTLMDYFDNDDLIEHCDGSWEMDNYIANKCKDAIEEYKGDNPILGRDEYIRRVQNCGSYEFKRFLCDLVDANYHISNEDLIQRLKEKLC